MYIMWNANNNFIFVLLLITKEYLHSIKARKQCGKILWLFHFGISEIDLIQIESDIGLKNYLSYSP